MTRPRTTPELAADEIVSDTTEIRVDLVCRYRLCEIVESAFDREAVRTLGHAEVRAARRYDPIVDAVSDVVEDAGSVRP